MYHIYIPLGPICRGNRILGILGVCQNFKSREIHLGRSEDKLVGGMIQETQAETKAVCLLSPKQCVF